MSSIDTGEEILQHLQTFLSRDVCKKGTAPLHQGVQLAIFVGEHGPFTIEKAEDQAICRSDAPTAPEMTIHVPAKAFEQLCRSDTQEVGEVGVEIIKLMLHSDPNFRIRAKVHIGLFGLLTNGYLAILPLGGGAVMKFLASSGLTSMEKIKTAIERFKVDP